MRKVGKFIVVGIGGMLLVLVLGMVSSAIFGIKPDELKELDLIRGWVWYRLGFYLVLLLAWPLFCRFVTRPRFNQDDLSEDELSDFSKRREKDIEYLSQQRWKIALLLVFFEIVIIQQFGL